MIEYPEDKFWGHYRGQVVSVDDPLSHSRVRVRILPAYSGSSDDALPWAIPAMPLFCGAKSGYGSHFVPDVGSWVWCFFEQGEYTQPVYFAEAPNGAMGLPLSKTDPKCRIVYSAEGCQISLDDTTKTVTVKSVTKVLVESSTVEVNGGTKVKVTAPTVEVNGGAEVKVTAPTVEVSGGTEVKVTAPTVTITGSTAVNIN